MSNQQDDDAPAPFASPPCFMHELDPDYSELPHPLDSRQQVDVTRWRKAEREKLILKDVRLGQNSVMNFAMIADNLDQIIADPAGLVVSVYSPIQGEPDLRAWIRRISERRAYCALPVVVGKSQPLVFRRWSPDKPLTCGDLDIQIPATGESVRPDIVIAPVIGFDSQCFRLGYGGGYFDRTLAALSPKPRILGVGYACCQITTIYPQPHDIAMDMVVSEAGISLPHVA